MRFMYLGDRCAVDQQSKNFLKLIKHFGLVLITFKVFLEL